MGGGGVRDVNWGCLLFIALTIAVDVAAVFAMRRLAAWLVAVAAAAAAG